MLTHSISNIYKQLLFKKFFKKVLTNVFTSVIIIVLGGTNEIS